MIKEKQGRIIENYHKYGEELFKIYDNGSEITQVREPAFQLPVETANC